ncbi:Golgi membrane exchange factor (Ric1p-Rgp1p) subunit [Ophidiomyces ophidiicola]|nr:Golgi membrane exchange factor (Ric1p-Rgp1p) subunit [Ophidiomyces ophidiicola]
MPSDIQVFVQWKDQTIFAGENVECTITFKHIAPHDAATDGKGSQKHYRGGSRPINVIETGTRYSPARSLNPFSYNNGNRRTSGQRARSATERGHRPSISLNSPHALSHSFPTSNPSPGSKDSPTAHGHKRSVSIISVEQPDLNAERKSFSNPFSPRQGKGHSRSTSVQVPTRATNGTQSAPRSPLPRISSVDSPSSISLPYRPEADGSRPSGRSSTPLLNHARRSPHKRGSPIPIDFKFPQAPLSPDQGSTPGTSSGLRIDTETSPSGLSVTSSASNATPTKGQGLPGYSTPATKILSNSIVDGSTRSSGEFYSLSNNSTETLESEYLFSPKNLGRLPTRHRRHHSNMDSFSGRQNQLSQGLLMGYAQISASFTIDSSLVNQSIFEEVKRKGVVGNQGRGGTPSKTEKSRQSFWGNFGLSSIGDSINGLLSGEELSGLRDMRGVSSSQSIPLLSTPQSLLFVDLRLNPGEEKSFSFSFTLPKGLPASHKGKAIKISYSLIIATQRAANPKDIQRVHRISIPFRVLSGVDSQGVVLGHDLMRPYVLLRDEARIQKVEVNCQPSPKEKSMSAKSWTSAPEFLSFVDEILGQKDRQGSLASIASPTEQPREPASGTLSCKDIIDLAILRSNQSRVSDQSPNRFEISHNGRRIAVIVLNRPAHRLGETVVATIDFSNALLPCYYLRGSLETYEKVAPTIALRSSTSIIRATRKVHATCFENTLFSTKVAFMPSIPISATPTLITSGINLEWQLRFEFVTCGLQYEDETGVSGVNLLETVERDDRGTVLAALENIFCQSFEVAIPLTVYGGVAQELETEELQGYSI